MARQIDSPRQRDRHRRFFLVYFLHIFYYFNTITMGDGKFNPRIIVFSTPNCGWCRKLKNYLREKGFRYRDVDISKDAKAADDLVRKTGQTGVPVTLINSRSIVGFNKKEIDRALKIIN